MPGFVCEHEIPLLPELTCPQPNFVLTHLMGSKDIGEIRIDCDRTATAMRFHGPHYVLLTREPLQLLLECNGTTAEVHISPS